MTANEPDVRGLPVTLCLIEDLYGDLEAGIETLAHLQYLGWTLHEEGIATAEEIDARLGSALEEVIGQLVTAVRLTGNTGTRQ